MLFVIDSNEYIFAFGPSPQSKSRDFLEKLLDKAHRHVLRVPRTIFKEVQRNLSPEAFQEFNALIHAFTFIDEDTVVPFEIKIELFVSSDAHQLKAAQAAKIKVLSV